MNNLKEGSRVRLTSKMINHDTEFLPQEDVPVGTEGTVMWFNCEGPIEYQQIAVNWDNGRTLCILPCIDKYEIV